MGASWHCPHEKRMDRIGTGIIQCKVDEQICLHQQYCPSKRKYEVTISSEKCPKRNREIPAGKKEGREFEEGS